MDTRQKVIWLRSLGVGSPEIARRLGIPRAEVNRIMRLERRRQKGGKGRT